MFIICGIIMILIGISIVLLKKVKSMKNDSELLEKYDIGEFGNMFSILVFILDIHKCKV